MPAEPPTHSGLAFTVLLSIYEREAPDYLDSCLKSLAVQTRQASQVVLVEDGPLSPALANVINTWRKSLSIDSVRLPTNEGLGRALNAGLAHCRHELVCRMDTDDICAPDRFARQIEYMESHPDVVLCGSTIVEIDPVSTQATGLRPAPESTEAIRRALPWRNPFNHMSVCFRLRAVLAVDGYRHRPLMEDYDLWLRLLAHPSAAYNIQTPLVRARAGSAMLARRSGRAYVEAEWQLYRDKVELGYSGSITGFAIFTCRAVPRLLPAHLLMRLYASTRKTPS